MTDDEVRTWLSEEERITWNDSDNTPTPRATIGVHDLLRALAETRKMLLSHGEHTHKSCPIDLGNDDGCDCGLDAFFATMPRPKV